MLKKNLKLIAFFVLLFLLGANFIFALDIVYPRIPGAIPPQDFVNSASQENILSLYVKYLVTLAIWIGGILAFAGLIYAGIKYVQSAGKPEKMASAKDQITGAVLGLLILLSAFLILKTINPELIELKISTLTSFEIPEPPDLPILNTEKTSTSIDIEVPFGRIIENIFETYDFTNHPDERDEEYVPRMLRIKNIVRAMLAENHESGLTDKLLEQSEILRDSTDECSCQETKPEIPCGVNDAGDTTWQCNCSGCNEIKPVSSDPCKKVRSDIQGAEEENLNVIYGGVEIEQLVISGDTKTITTSLTQEIIKTEEEIRLLKEELYKLKRSDKFILECPVRLLSSWTQLASKKDILETEGDILRNTNFWDNINIIYYPEKYGRFYTGQTLFTDFATLYCAVSGTMEQEDVFTVPDPRDDDLTGEESVQEAENVFSESFACSSDEAPVGEISDRTKRVTQLLIDKLEELIEKDRELINAVDGLQVLVSQCSSKRGCERRCTCFPCLPQCMYRRSGRWYCGSGCEGWDYACADSSSAYPGPCLERDEDTPCPYAEIENQIEKIRDIYQEIMDIIEGKEDKDTPDTIGIINIIDDIAPEIINDLGREIRIPMKNCSSEDYLKQKRALFNAAYVKGSIIPGGRSPNLNCRTTKIENGIEEQTIYGDCFEECYLEKGHKEHRQCVQECLNGLSIMLDDPKIKECIHELNFYCCDVE